MRARMSPFATERNDAQGPPVCRASRWRRPAGHPPAPFAWPRRAWLGPQPAWLRAPVPALGGSVPWAATAAAALREPAPVPEVADLALLSFFQVHRMRRAQVRPRVSLTHGSRHSAPCARRLGPHVGRVSVSWVADQSDRPNCYVCYVCEGWHGKGLDEPAAERQDPMGGRPRVFLRSRTIPRLDSGWQPWGHDLRCSPTLGTG